MNILYNHHWRSWNRVLEAKDGVFVEINLTHVNGNWESVKNEVIRQHRTMRSFKDILQEFLPHTMRKILEDKVGVELANRLLTYDYLPEIDWAKYREIANGGASFNQIRKT